MDANSFAARIEAANRELDDFVRRTGPVAIGNLAVEHFKDNFRKGGFVDRSLEEWQPVKRLGTLAGAAGQYGPLLSSRNHLYSSLIYRPGIARVTITTPVAYAPIHNEGGVTHPTVTPKMRKFAWYKYYSYGGGKSKGAEEPENAAVWKRIALTKKQKLAVKIPQRKFIGESAVLTKKIQDKITAEITKILKF